MGWRELPSWLKGGIIGVLSSLILVILSNFFYWLLYGTNHDIFIWIENIE